MVWNALEASGAFVRCGRRRGGRVVGLWPEGEKRLGEPTQWCHQAVSMRRPQSVAGPGPSAAFRTRDEPCGKSAVFAQKKCRKSVTSLSTSASLSNSQVQGVPEIHAKECGG
jgi:hypothetical protein